MFIYEACGRLGSLEIAPCLLIADIQDFDCQAAAERHTGKLQPTNLSHSQYSPSCMAEVH